MEAIFLCSSDLSIVVDFNHELKNLIEINNLVKEG